MSFNVGDRVQIKEDDFSDAFKGRQGTVETTKSSVVRIQWDSPLCYTGNYFASRFELIGEKKMKYEFKVGDKVRLVDNRNCSGRTKGDIATVCEDFSTSSGTALIAVCFETRSRQYYCVYRFKKIEQPPSVEKKTRELLAKKKEEAAKFEKDIVTLDEKIDELNGSIIAALEAASLAEVLLLNHQRSINELEELLNKSGN